MFDHASGRVTPIGRDGSIHGILLRFKLNIRSLLATAFDLSLDRICSRQGRLWHTFLQVETIP